MYQILSQLVRYCRLYIKTFSCVFRVTDTNITNIMDPFSNAVSVANLTMTTGCRLESLCLKHNYVSTGA